MTTITFHGATGGVTGSCHLFENNHKAFLLDCGMFQGQWEVESQNYAPFPFRAEAVDGLILSHGHLDHCGRIPVLVKNGFHGHIYSTPPTKDIARLILLDAAHLHKEEFDWKKRRLARKGIEVSAPLYSTEDVYYSMDFFDMPVGYDTPISLSEDVRLSFHFSEAGHILGSAQTFIEYQGRDGMGVKQLLYTGDLGDGDRPVVKNPSSPNQSVDVLVMESTYGNREHKSYAESVLEFEEAIVHTLKKKGSVLIPTFALERAQEILYHIGLLKKTGKIARNIPVFLNSPLAINITRLYHTHCAFCDPKLQVQLTERSSPFIFPGLILSETIDESRAIHNFTGPKIILAGSGMMTGGRIKHHLKHLLWRENTTLIIVGFQTQGSLGRRIVDGENPVKIFGEEVAVKAKIYTINGFSAHADRHHLVEFAKKAMPKKVFLVHGEPDALKSLKHAIQTALPQTEVTVPGYGETFPI